MPPPSRDSHIQECSTCGALLDVTAEEPFALMHCPTCGAAMRVRRRFDHFAIQEELGAGGMGTVYRALDTNLNRPVALKLLQRQHSGNPEFVAQFQKEAAITASINHPHVVKVYSTGRDHGLVYIAMELVDKGSLESLMHAQGKVAELQVLTIGVQIAQGLQAALEKGLIHRDIKPGNILFANAATAKMVDFGLAVLAEHAGTVAGEVWATPYYVAPEVTEGHREDFRSDMYSLGATLFHAIAGKPPHAVETNSMSELAAAKKVPVDLHAAAPEASSTTAFVLNKVLNHDPTQRHQSYAEFIEHLEFARTELLESLATNEQKQAAEEAAAARDWSWLTPLVAMLVVVLGVGAFYLRDHLPTKPPVEVVEEEVPQTQERIDAKYEEARKLLVAGETAKAAEALTKLDAQTTAPQPLRNWITLNAGLAELLAGREEAAQKHFAAIIERGIYSPDPAEQDLAKFFVDTAKRAAGKEPIVLDAVADLNREHYEALGFFIYGVKDWSLGAYDEAWKLFRQFTGSTPQDRHAWISEYKPLASPYLVEINAFRAAHETALAANSLEARQRALQLVKDTLDHLRLPSQFPLQLKATAEDLQKKIAAEQEEAARQMSATEAADAKVLAEAQAKIAPLWQQFRLMDAVKVATSVQVAGEKGRLQRAGMIKRMEWLAKFKTTLMNDLNTVGYPLAVTKKTGGQIPGPVRRANEVQIETVTPFGSLPALWTDLAPESILAMGKSFLRPELPAETLADRQWLLGVYAMQAGRQREGRELLLQASQAQEGYREDLHLFLESTDAP
jgi:serine/threonine protein kinase